MSLFEYTHLLQTMFYHFLISPRNFRENHIQEDENIDRMVALLQLMPPNRIVFAAFFWMRPERSYSEIKFFVLKPYISCSVLSQDYNGVVFIGVRWLEPQKRRLKFMTPWHCTQ